MVTRLEIIETIKQLPESDISKLSTWLQDYKDKQVTQRLTLKQIESAIFQLPPDEAQKFLEWISDLDYQQWDKQLEKDITDGKLETMAQEAITDYKTGRCRAI